VLRLIDTDMLLRADQRPGGIAPILRAALRELLPVITPASFGRSA
jgi:hypothetical protein